MDPEVVIANLIKLFELADADKDGVIGIDDAAFFIKAKLPSTVLGQIWQLADSNSKGFLTEEEFFFACKMISLAQQGKDFLNSSVTLGENLIPNFGDNAKSLTEMWNINEQDKQKYFEHFKEVDTNNDGFISGEEAKVILGNSGLEKADLSKIWISSDVTSDGKLDQEEFAVAMHLINQRLKTGKVPELPLKSENPSLVSSNSSNSSTSTVVSNLNPILETNNNNVPVPQTPLPEWKLTAEERDKYANFFRYATETTKTSFVEKEQAKSFFLKSGLHPMELAKIWSLSDYDNDGRLDESQFIIAMFLINSKLRGFEVPNSLPDFLQKERRNSRSMSASSITVPNISPTVIPQPLPTPQVVPQTSEILSLSSSNEIKTPKIPEPNITTTIKNLNNLQTNTIQNNYIDEKSYEKLKFDLDQERNKRLILEQRVSQLESVVSSLANTVQSYLSNEKKSKPPAINETLLLVDESIASYPQTTTISQPTIIPQPVIIPQPTQPVNNNTSNTVGNIDDEWKEFEFVSADQSNSKEALW